MNLRDTVLTCLVFLVVLQWYFIGRLTYEYEQAGHTVQEVLEIVGRNLERIEALYKVDLANVELMEDLYEHMEGER